MSEEIIQEEEIPTEDTDLYTEEEEAFEDENIPTEE